MPVRSVVVRLQPTLEAPGKARAAVRGACDSVGDPGVSDTAELLTSELVTNAVVHGDGVITVAVECRPGTVAVAVGDECPRRPQPVRAGAGDTHGRGLRIVSALAGAWGVRAGDDGAAAKFVWFSLP